MGTTLKIHIIYKKDQPGSPHNLLANATIVIYTDEYEYVTIKGFQIWKSVRKNTRLDANINITPPSRMAHGKTVQFVFVESKAMWQILEKAIYNKYLKHIDDKDLSTED